VPRHDPTDLSSAALQYLLAVRSAASEERRVSTAQVARRLKVSTQAASDMFHRLAADGLVRQGDGRELRLTAAGRAAADAMYRRHALVEWLLVSVVGLAWADADEEAARLQASVSPRLEARLDDLMGHPETCPHGNPIDEAACRRRPAGMPLADLEAGEQATIYRVLAAAAADPAFLSYLEARALLPGAHISILARSSSLDAITVEGPRGRATLGLRPAAHVLVLRGEADPALFHRVPGRGER
jgi:DtxR family Mn-dependent transcriptional regulator